MVESALRARSALAGLLGTGHQSRPATVGVTMTERSGLDIVTVAALRGQRTAVAAATREAFGLDLPTTPRRVGDGRLAFLWAGDARWTAVSEAGDDHLETMVRERLGGLAAITAQSDGRVVLRLSGPSARDVLGKAVAIDLHPRAFRPGDVALTPAFHIAVQVWQVDDSTELRSVGRAELRRKPHSLADRCGRGVRRRCHGRNGIPKPGFVTSALDAAIEYLSARRAQLRAFHRHAGRHLRLVRDGIGAERRRVGVASVLGLRPQPVPFAPYLGQQRTCRQQENGTR